MYEEVPPVHEAVKLSYCPVLTFGVLEAVRAGVDKAGFMAKVLEYPDVTVFVPESVITTFASSGLLEASALTVGKA